MESINTYITSMFLVFALSTAFVNAQSRIQKLYSHSSIEWIKKSEPSKKIVIRVFKKDHQPLVESYVRIDDTELEFDATEEGEILVEIPAQWKEKDVHLSIFGKGYYSKSIKISFDNFKEVYRTITLKKRRVHRIDGCPSF